MLPVFAQTNSQVLPTSDGTLNVEFALAKENPNVGEETKMDISFINPQTEKIQVHIDYKVSVTKDGEYVFGPMQNLVHTSEGEIHIPIQFSEEGMYVALVEVEGILFQPIPLEVVSFSFPIGDAQAQSDMPTQPDDQNGGGCLIATAAFGSELSPQVQQLRETRDNVVLNTNSGVSFMIGFNQLYYSFSPTIADLERENPFFKETIKMIITPMLASLSILNHVDIDSEQEMLGYGIGVILVNVGFYVGLPVFGVLKLYQWKRR